jgi:hypothetical protein
MGDWGLAAVRLPWTQSLLPINFRFSLNLNANRYPLAAREPCPQASRL